MCADLVSLLHTPTVPPRLGLSWLGQAGFLLRWQEVRVVVDPYLSDSLATKYRGARFPHIRMVPPPVAPEQLVPIDAVLCTHAHTDHMDPGTVPGIAAANPACRFVVPVAERATAIARGVPEDRLIAVNAGDRADLGPGLSVHAVRAAHETLRTDAAGNHHFLGYVLRLGDVVLYHSGDCVPFPGLAEDLTRFSIDVALLPVNGRDAQRREQGVPGNFTFDEATALCNRCKIAHMVACHFGLFEFNTVAPSWLDEQITKVTAPLRCVRPELGHVYWFPRADRPHGRQD